MTFVASAASGIKNLEIYFNRENTDLKTQLTCLPIHVRNDWFVPVSNSVFKSYEFRVFLFGSDSHN